MTCYSINEKLGFFTYRSTRSSPSLGFPGRQSASKKVGFFRDTKKQKTGGRSKITGSVGADEEAARSGGDVEVEPGEERRLPFVRELEPAHLDPSHLSPN